MALEPKSSQRSISPSSPIKYDRPISILSRARVEEESYRKDKGYRRYAASVERALLVFDTALHEWADYISFLGRLLKALQGHPAKISVVPVKADVAKRLAQCLNPALPSGVHQKTIEVYDYIFSLIGSEGLRHDLPLYFPGLSSTLTFASLSVRPSFLSLMEKHVLSLPPNVLRPALKAVILALLPGLEEETSEDFGRTLDVLNGFRSVIQTTKIVGANVEESSDDQYFWQSFFLASLTSSSRRSGALAFLIRSFPMLGDPQSRSYTIVREKISGSENQKSNLPPEVESMVSPEPGLLIRCLVAGLSDEQLLIQRGFLDLLVTKAPLHSSVLQDRVSKDDLERLVIAAAGIVSRRDTSLNRRLWAWFLGPEPVGKFETDSVQGSPAASPARSDGTVTPTEMAGSSQTHYFEAYGLRALVQGLRHMILRNSQTPLQRAKPFRICLSLMDRWEVGSLVVPEIFLTIIDSVRQYKDMAESADAFNEVLRSASVFFDGVESGHIWGEIYGLISAAMDGESVKQLSPIQCLDLVQFVVKSFSLQEEEMLECHIPLVTVALVTKIAQYDGKLHQNTGVLNINKSELVSSALTIANQLVSMIPDRVIQRSSLSKESFGLNDPSTFNDDVLSSIKRFYVQDQGNLSISSSPYAISQWSRLLLQQCGRIFIWLLNLQSSSSDLESSISMLTAIIRKLPTASEPDILELFSALKSKLIYQRTSDPPSLSHRSLCNITRAITTLYAHSHLSSIQVSQLVPSVVDHAWYHLAPTCPKYHVETVRSLWQLQEALPRGDRQIEAAITAKMVERDQFGTYSVRSAEAGMKFAILWTQTHQLYGAHIESNHVPQTPIAKSSGTQDPAKKLDYEIMLAKPLFLMLDAMADPSTELFIFVRSWIQTLPTVKRLFHTILTKFFACNFLRDRKSDPPSIASRKHQYNMKDTDDLEDAIYCFQTISNLLRWSQDSVWATLSRAEVFSMGNLEYDPPDQTSVQTIVTNLCITAIHGTYDTAKPAPFVRTTTLHRTALSVLHQILSNPYAVALAELELEDILIQRLLFTLQASDSFIQIELLECLFDSLKLRSLRATGSVSTDSNPPFALAHHRAPSKEILQNSRLSLNTDRSEKDNSTGSFPPPPQLVKCFQAAFSSPAARPVLDSWVTFLAGCLPLYAGTIFQVLLPLVESLCTQITIAFDGLKEAFMLHGSVGPTDSDVTVITLLDALEMMLATGHDRLMNDEFKDTSVKSPEQSQGFLSTMVSGVFASENPLIRSATANDRLTVILTFQDTVRICFAIWSWGVAGSTDTHHDPASSASCTYSSRRMRSRARKILEHLFRAEPLECLETLVEIWRRANIAPQKSPASVIALLGNLDGSRPRFTVPATFNAVYSRTSPNALDPLRKSSLTSELADTDVMNFLVEYATSLEDDAMDEIWTDCMTFIKDVLSNPFPHRQTLPKLLEFTAILGTKVDNTNFGEQRRMRRELADLFMRVLTATFTAKPMGFAQDISIPAVKDRFEITKHSLGSQASIATRADDIISILVNIIPNMPIILVDSDRVLAAATSISAHVIVPTLKSKLFPENMSKGTLDILYRISRLPNTQKLWKKDISDAFNDPRFLYTSLSLVTSNWLQLLRQWTLSDKDRMPELLSRLSAPTAAGIVFGVGAQSARLEGDRRAQLNLRRTSLLILAAADDTFTANLPSIHEKISELLAATSASSPSSLTRAEIFMLIRALALKTNHAHLSPLWPLVSAELQAAIASVLPNETTTNTYNMYSVLQACKLLDLLLVLAPDDFQLHDWLFVTDTIDAVYRPASFQPIALIDQVSNELNTLGSTPTIAHHEGTPADVASKEEARKKPLLNYKDTRGVKQDQLLRKVLRPFFSQLSIYAFESTYGMGSVDWEECKQGVLVDLFDEETIVAG